MAAIYLSARSNLFPERLARGSDRSEIHQGTLYCAGTWGGTAPIAEESFCNCAKMTRNSRIDTRVPLGALRPYSLYQAIDSRP